MELSGGDGPVFSLAWAPDGQSIAAAGDRQINIWRLATAAPTRRFRNHPALVRSLDWSTDRKLIASVRNDGKANVWNVDTLNDAATLQTGARAIKWSPDGRPQATGGASGSLQLWNSESGALLHTSRLQTMISSLSWSPIAIGSPPLSRTAREARVE